MTFYCHYMATNGLTEYHLDEVRGLSEAKLKLLEYLTGIQEAHLFKTFRFMLLDKTAEV